jgi:integrase
MSEAHSTSTARPNKPPKPSPDFPLFPQAAGYWAKKIRGKLYYFGPWADPDAALAKYRGQAEALHSGRRPRDESAEVTVKDAANAFLNHKQALLDAGELAERTWLEYKAAADLVVGAFGKRRLVEDLGPEDFAGLRNKMAATWGPVRLGNTIQYVRSVFKHALDAGLIDRPVRFGPGFKRPSKKVLRLNRAKAGPKLFTADEVRRLVGTAGTTMKAMILLGINCGFGNADCARLPRPAVDLDAGIIDFPRPKTGIPRRCPLWPETAAALRDALAKRTEPIDPADAGLLFVTAAGRSWGGRADDRPVSKRFSELLRELGINCRKGLGFYTLRHTFRTVADEAKDQPAADYIMGHEVPHMSSIYRETIGDARLKAVTDHVYKWLFAAPDPRP